MSCIWDYTLKLITSNAVAFSNRLGFKPNTEAHISYLKITSEYDEPCELQTLELGLGLERIMVSTT